MTHNTSFSIHGTVLISREKFPHFAKKMCRFPKVLKLICQYYVLTQHTSLYIHRTVLILRQKFHHFSWEMLRSQTLFKIIFFTWILIHSHENIDKKLITMDSDEKMLMMIFGKSAPIFKSAPDHFVGIFPNNQQIFFFHV